MENSDTYTILEIDAKTGANTLRPMTTEEIAERKESELRQIEIEAEIEAKKLARTSALAKLAALGLTEDEIAAL